jgi:hypothetical protein
MMPPKISLSQNKSHANDAGQKEGSSWAMKGKKTRKQRRRQVSSMSLPHFSLP